MVAPRLDFPPVRACLFDMDGLILDSEDIYTECTNTILHNYNKPSLPWHIKAQLQGRPGPAAGAIFHEWAQLPITPEEFQVQQSALQKKLFPNAQPLPGAETLLQNLAGARTVGTGQRVHIALATSSHSGNFALKTAHLEELFSVFSEDRRVKGDDPRVLPGRGKPSPDIYLLALKTVNDSLALGEKPITPEECLVFEDSVPGVESGRRAGMRVVWVPHQGLAKEYAGREAEVLAGRTGEAGDVDLHLVGEIGDGWADQLDSLVEFPYERFGIDTQSQSETARGATL